MLGTSRRLVAPTRAGRDYPAPRPARAAPPIWGSLADSPCPDRLFRVPRSALRVRQAADQLLAVRWVRSSAWDCYLPAALLNAWHLLLAGALPKFERGTRNTESRTARLPDLPC